MPMQPHPTHNSCLWEQLSSQTTNCSLQRVFWGTCQQASACQHAEAKQFGMELDFTKLLWLSASVFESAYRPHIQSIWEIHAGFSGDHRWRTLALSFQNLLSGFWGYVTPSCWCTPTTLFLLIFLRFSQASSSLSYHNSMLASFYHGGHVLTHLGLLFSHSFRSTPQECLLLPTHPYLIQSPRLCSILPLKIF